MLHRGLQLCLISHPLQDSPLPYDIPAMLNELHPECSSLILGGEF
jgi:hypothetical protein